MEDPNEDFQALIGIIAQKAFVSPADVRPETDLFVELAFDSLGLLEMLVAVERHFGIRLEATRYHRERIDTAGKIHDLIQKVRAEATRSP